MMMTQDERELLILLAEMMYQTYAASLASLYKGDDKEVANNMAPVRNRLVELITKLRHG